MRAAQRTLLVRIVLVVLMTLNRSTSVPNTALLGSLARGISAD
jgi:hypothetical protein